MLEEIYLPSPLSLRQMNSRTRVPEELYPGPSTYATVQPSAIADGLAEVARLWAIAAYNMEPGKRFVYRKDASFTTTTQQYVVSTYCISYNITGALVSGEEIEFPLTIYDEDLYDPITFTLSEANLLNQEVDIKHSLSLYFIDDPELLLGVYASLAALAVIPDTTAGVTNIFTCSIDGRLGDTTMVVTRSTPKYVTGSIDGVNSP